MSQTLELATLEAAEVVQSNRSMVAMLSAENARLRQALSECFEFLHLLPNRLWQLETVTEDDYTLGLHALTLAEQIKPDTYHHETISPAPDDADQN